MAALMRCARYPRLISRSLGISKGTTAEISTIRKGLTFRTSQVIRFPTVLSCTPTSRHLSVPARDRGFGTETAAYSAEYPASEFWRHFNFSSLTMQESTFDRYLLLMESRLYERKGFSAVEFYYLMKLAEEQDSFTVDEAIILIMTTGYMNKYVDQAERNKWTHYLTTRFKALGVKLDVRYYSEVLHIYDKNAYDYSPVDFLAQIEADGIAPNRIMLSRLIQRYCVMGDMKSATQILDHMKQSDFPISQSLYNSLIRGHFNAGDTESAMKMFDGSELVGFEPDAGTYYSAIVGYALQDDMPNVKKLLTQVQENNIILSDGVYSSLIEEVAARGLTHFVEYFLQLLKAGSTFYYNEAHDTLKVLMQQGNYEIAFKYFEGLSDPIGRLFFNPAIISKMPVEEIIKYARYMKQQGTRLSSVTDLLECAMQKFNYDMCVQILPYLEIEGEEFRSHYTWPYICSYRDVKDLDGIKKLLPLCVVDAPTIMDYLNPALISLGMDVKEYQQLLKEHTSMSPHTVNACTLAMVVQKDGVEAGLETMKKLKGFEGMKNFGESMVPFIVESVRSSGNWKAALELISNMEKKMNGYINPHSVVMAITNQLKEAGESLQPVADVMTETGIIIDEGTARVSGLSNVLTEQKLNAITFKADSTERLDLEAMDKMNPKQLERLARNSPRKYFVRNYLINKLYRQKDWSALESFMMEFDLSTVHSARSRELLALFYLYQKNDAIKAGKCLLNNNFEKYVPTFHLVYNTASELALAGQYEDAKELISKHKTCYKTENMGLNVRGCHFFNRKPTPQNVQEAEEMFDLLVKNGYVNNKTGRNILQAYTAMVAKTCDADQICTMMDNLAEREELKYISLVPILAPVIQHEDKASLQKLFDHLSDTFSEKKLLFSLSAAFLQEGKSTQARKVLMTPGLSCEYNMVYDVCRPWIQEGKSELMQKYYNTMKDVRNADKKQLIFLTFMSMCNERPVRVDDCLAFFDTRFEEEGLFADANMLKYYKNFLKFNNRPDHPAAKRYLGDQEATPMKDTKTRSKKKNKKSQGTSAPVGTDMEAVESPNSIPKGDQELQSTSGSEVNQAVDSAVNVGTSTVTSDSYTFIDSEAISEMESSKAEEIKPVEGEIRTTEGEEMKTNPAEELKDDYKSKDDSVLKDDSTSDK